MLRIVTIVLISFITLISSASARAEQPGEQED